MFTYSELTILSRNYAIKKHKGLYYNKNKKTPYSYHLDMVFSFLHIYSEETRIASFLHDIIEDTDTTFEDLSKLFGLYIAKLVYYTTDEQGVNRKERKFKTNEKLSNIPAKYYNALVLKCADRLSNMFCALNVCNNKLIFMYTNEYNDFRKSVYRPNLCDELWIKLDQIYLDSLSYMALNKKK